jgi:hypothetical protein
MLKTLVNRNTWHVLSLGNPSTALSRQRGYYQSSKRPSVLSRAEGPYIIEPAARISRARRVPGRPRNGSNLNPQRPWLSVG